MNRFKVLINIFANLTNLGVIILLAFFVSPILVHRLGNELYGVWTLIVQITGYFTVLDLGVNTAIVRFISKYTAQQAPHKANEIYNTSIVFFLIVSLIVIVITIVFGMFFADFFALKSISRVYAYTIFCLVGIDIAGNLLFGVLAATLNGLQEFLTMNGISTLVAILKNAIIVIMLFQGYRLFTLAMILLGTDVIRFGAYYVLLRKKYPSFYLDRTLCHTATIKQIFNYSMYSFVMAIARRIIFLSDSIVIGRMLNVHEVTFFAIPATLIEYLGKIVEALTNTFVPVISSHEAVGKHDKNADIYLIITKYLLGLTLPVLFVLLTVGNDFIGIWMGAEYGARSVWVLRILVVGYMFSYAQWVAYGVLVGTSKHRFLAYVMSLEAVANLGLSVLWARKYGIEGVALGTTIPLVLVNIFVVPVYTCHVMHLSLIRYFQKSHTVPFLLLLVSVLMYVAFPVHVSTYLQVVSFSAAVMMLWAIAGFFLLLESEHRTWLIHGIRRGIHAHFLRNQE